MSRTSLQHIKNAAGESRQFRARVLAGLALMVLALMALSVRFFWLQVIEHDEFSTRARDNRVHLRHLPPARGLIYDRNGTLLADNQPAFRLEVVPERVKNMDDMLARLRRIVPLSRSNLKAFHKQLAAQRSFQSVPLKFDLSQADMSAFAVNRWQFPGVEIHPYLTRVYPQGRYFAHLVGYVGRIDADDLVRRDAERYAGTTHIGKTGIERYYESLLHGEPGYELAEVNANQRPLRVLERKPPVAGKSLILTVDARLQKTAMDALGDHTGAVVAIDPRNGQVLAMVSKPGFDPNLFVNGISQRDYSALLHDPLNPFLDRALRGIYPPGSTVKPFIGLGGLVLGIRKPEDTVVSTGTWYLPGQERGYRDDRRGGFGRVDLREAIMQSVNTYFYQLAHDMGIDKLSSFMARFGFGKPTGIDLVGEASGVLPSREWKRGQSSQPWYPGETVIAGIGQGYWAVTPLQLAHAVATLAEDGESRRPHLLLATRQGVDGETDRVPAPPAVHVVPDKPADFAVVRQGMVDVVNGPQGTARGLGEGFPYVIAGKTGTAERYSRTTDAYTPRKSHEQLATLHRALFIAYTPAEAPRIAVAVIVDEGAWGSTAAAPVARKVLDAWYQDDDRGSAGSAARAAGSAGP